MSTVGSPSAAPKQPFDPKAWARRILARNQAGEKVSKTVLQMARNALPREYGNAA